MKFIRPSIACPPSVGYIQNTGRLEGVTHLPAAALFRWRGTKIASPRTVRRAAERAARKGGQRR